MTPTLPPYPRADRPVSADIGLVFLTRKIQFSKGAPPPFTGTPISQKGTT